MEDYETEEQQLEAIKKWWNENGTSILVGLGIGVAVLTGWNYYAEHKHQHSVEASDLYASIITQIASNKFDENDVAMSNKLTTEYTDTPYASLSSLAQAKYRFEKGELDDAVSHLEWVIENGLEEETQHIARLRLARILLDQDKYSEAEAVLSAEHSPAFDARFEELKGDMFVAVGDIEQARVAYDKSIKQDVNASQTLILKRQDLGF